MEKNNLRFGDGSSSSSSSSLYIPTFTARMPSKASEPGSGSTPAPARPTGNPFPLASRLATSSSPRLPTTDSSDWEAHASISAARALAVSNLELLTLRLEWVERLCEPGAPLQDLKEAAEILDPRSHMELIEERHSLELCPYPPCKRKAGAPYAPEEEQSFKVSLRSNGLYAAGGKKGSAAFCSKLCEARSEWFNGMLGTSRTELLEDVEARRRAVSSSIPSSTAPPPSPLPIPPLPASPLNTELISSLSIHERPTPSSVPAPPTPSFSFERPLTTPSASHSLSRARPARSPLSSSSASALLPFDGAGIGKTVLQASRTLGAGRTEEEGEEEEKGWAEEESEEVKGWIEEALEVRRKVEEGEL